MTCLVYFASSGSSLSAPTSTIADFHSTQPRPRTQVASSTGSPALNVARLSPDKNVHAMPVSQAGSPTAEQPKSMTELRRPLSTSRFVGLTSPWTHTGGPCQVALSASCQTSAARAVSISPSRAVRASRVCES